MRLPWCQDRAALWGPILEAEEANDDVERFDDADLAKTVPKLAISKDTPQDLDRFDDGSDDEEAVKEATVKDDTPSHREHDEQGYDMRKR
jgi:hypothetical protein